MNQCRPEKRSAMILEAGIRIVRGVMTENKAESMLDIDNGSAGVGVVQSANKASYDPYRLVLELHRWFYVIRLPISRTTLIGVEFF